MTIIHDFDIRTAITTAILIPMLWIILRKIATNTNAIVGFATDGVLWVISRALRRSVAARVSLRRYCRSQLEDPRSKLLQVPGRVDTVIEVDRIFVPLLLDQPGVQSTYSHADLVDAGTRICIVGDSGSGKSSLAKRLYRDACRAAVRSPSQARLPILIELRIPRPPPTDDPAVLSDWAFNLIKEQVVRFAGYEMEHCFDIYSSTAGLLLILDGLDEVASSDNPRMAVALNQLSDRLRLLGSTNVIVLTMRTQFHQTVKRSLPAFPLTLFVRPFSPNEIYELLTKWEFGADRRENIARIYSDLTDRPTLREMCSNPLVLAMYISNDALTQFNVPETRTEFYSSVVEELLVLRRARQVGPTRLRARIKEERERILGRIALEHLLDATQPANSLDWNSAIAVVQSVTDAVDTDDAERFFRELGKETGLFTEERVGETFRFIHLTFCEFFAAKEAVDGRTDGFKEVLATHENWASAKSPYIQSRLIEVVPFCCSLIPRYMRSDAISSVAALDDDLLLARCFLETQLYEHELWPDFIQRVHDWIVDSAEQEWDEPWLRRLHVINVVLREADLCRAMLGSGGSESSAALEDMFQELVRSDAGRLVKVFSSYAAQDASAALRLADSCGIDLLAERPDLVIESCPEPPFLALALSRLDHLPVRSTEYAGWSAVLTEAALRYPIVAQALLNETAEGHVVQAGQSDEGPGARWPVAGMRVRKSLYRHLLARSVGDATNESNLASSLTGLRACARFWMPAKWPRVVLPMGYLLVALGLIRYGSMSRADSGRTVFLAIVTLIYMATIGLILVSGTRRRLLRLTLNTARDERTFLAMFGRPALHTEAIVKRVAPREFVLYQAVLSVRPQVDSSE